MIPPSREADMMQMKIIKFIFPTPPLIKDNINLINENIALVTRPQIYPLIKVNLQKINEQTPAAKEKVKINMILKKRSSKRNLFCISVRIVINSNIIIIEIIKEIIHFIV